MFKAGAMTSLAEPILGDLAPGQLIDSEVAFINARSKRAQMSSTCVPGRVPALPTSDRRLQQLAAIAVLAPTFTPALEAHGEVLDMLGQSELARSKYDVARRVKVADQEGAPDRPFVLRNRGHFTSAIAAYSETLRSVKQRAPALYRARQRLSRRGTRQTGPSRLRIALSD